MPKNKELTKILWILGQYNSRHVIKHVTLQFTLNTVYFIINSFNTIDAILFNFFQNFKKYPE